MSKYELYCELMDAHNLEMYVYIDESDDVNDLLERKKQVVCKYILINNFRLAALIDGEPLSSECYDTDEYRDMITECKISKHIIKANVDDTRPDAMEIIEKMIEKGEREAEEYFARHNIRRKAKIIPFNKPNT